MQQLLLASTLLIAAPAVAGDVLLGIGAGVVADLPDPVSKETTRFGPGPSLQLPIRFGVASHARIRVTARADLGVGRDRVTWGQEIDGAEVRFYDDDHFAMLLAGGLTVGPELVLPLDGPVRPHIGAEAGVAWVGTYHSFEGATALLVDPKQNDVNDPNNVDPYTSQPAFLTDVHAGIVTGDKVGMWADLGYSMAWVGQADLQKSPSALSARREAFGWNTLRLALGLNITL